MGLKKLTDNIYYKPHQPALDRPLLAYLDGGSLSLAIDAGYSEAHVRDFYHCLDQSNLKRPDLTILTHWHYDHTFGMRHIHGASIALAQTNAHLENQRKLAERTDYIDQLKREDPCFRKEYETQPDPIIVLSGIQFQDQLVFRLGNLTAAAFHTESPHTDDAVCVYVPEEKVLFLGDSTSEDFFNHSYMDPAKLRKLVQMIERTDCIYCVLSHAEPLKKAELLAYLYSVLES